MNTLLIDSSSRKIEFAYNKNGIFSILNVLDEKKNADELIFEIKKAFGLNNFNFQDINYVVLSNGPGSFTGLRIGSVISKGICFSTGAKLIELSTLDIIANKIKDSSEEDIITPLIFSFSKNGYFYFADYLRNKDGLKRISDYGFINKDELISKNHIYPSNDNLDFSKEIKYINVSGENNMFSMYELFLKNKDNVADYKTSEPFYMKRLPGY